MKDLTLHNRINKCNENRGTCFICQFDGNTYELLETSATAYTNVLPNVVIKYITRGLNYYSIATGCRFAGGPEYLCIRIPKEEIV